MMTHTRIPTIQPITIATLEEDLSLPDGLTVVLVDIDDEILVVGSNVTMVGITEDIVVNGKVDNTGIGVDTVDDTGVDTVMDIIVNTGVDMVVDTVVDTF